MITSVVMYLNMEVSILYLGIHLLRGLNLCQSADVNSFHGSFIFSFGVTLLFCNSSLTLLIPFCTFRYFGKCQRRRWRILFCVSVSLGVCALVSFVSIAIFSFFVGLSLYPNVNLFAVGGIENCDAFEFYSSLVWLSIFHIIVGIIVVLTFVAGISLCCYRLVKCTIFE